MYCSQCGAPVDQNAAFCSRCGTKLVPDEKSTNESTTEVSSPSVDPHHVRPWVRFWARSFDLYTYCLVGGIVLGIVAPRFLVSVNEIVLGMILIFSWIFVEALLLSSLQTTPGKWLFKTRLAPTSGIPISFQQALSRSVKVWWRGMGTGFPVATLITQIIAHQKLTRNGITSWDKDDGFIVTHETIGVLRVLVAIVFFTAFFFFVAAGNCANI